MLAACLALGGLLIGTGDAGAQNVDPTQWPAVPGLDPYIETTAHSIRFAGPDRYQTNLALNLALRGKGDFPFDTPDPTSGGAANLAAADDWWGAGTCPRSILVVAGDTFADALAAASLSDPSDRSSQPRVQRVAAADPLFDPIGGFDRVDTAFAPIVVTHSARMGATALAQTARLTASDFAKGGCTTAREAIIVGGLNAVPAGVGPELVELGYREVFRVSGVDRYDTAARVATALGTGTPPPAGTPCEDPDVTDGDARMGWYGNAVIEFRTSGTDCRLQGRTVVLADGFTGADALAAGWWTSFWQVPVLLTNPDGTLPPATRTALQTLNVNSIVVLGGTQRIPETTVDEAKALSGAVAGRVAGPDRYATSVEMAKQFGGWFPTGDGADFENNMICLAASSGVGPTATGWPDALAAGPMCGRLGSGLVGPPLRLAAPAEANPPPGRIVGGTGRAHTATPILLGPSGGTVLPVSISSLLRSTFGVGTWCGEEAFSAECVEPGFGVVFGGPGAISEDLSLRVADLVAGDTYDRRSDLGPLVNGFMTRLDLGPVFRIEGDDAPTRFCAPRASIEGVRWLSVTEDSHRSVLAVDLVERSLYDSSTPSPANVPFCVQADYESGPRTVWAVGLSGRQRPQTRVTPDPERWLAAGPSVVLGAGTSAAGQWTFSGAPTSPAALTIGRRIEPIQRASVRMDTPQGGQMLTGQLSIVIDEEILVGQLTAEAVATADGWAVRGRVVLARATGRYVGGFSADLGRVPQSGVAWAFDALRD